jgi:hypothetical protein
VRRRGSSAFLLAILGALVAAPSTLAETISVDNDRADCTAAAFTSVQDAIDAAAPGDTIAICPGTYTEGNGNPNTSALRIDKTLTLKGAGADLVTISPRRYDGNDGVIAEDPQDIRYPSGNIITAVGTPAVPITLDISGVTIDGGGVAAKAGVVFLDAQGSLVRSRVTDIVTSESPGAFDQPGGYRSEFLGYGVALVTAAQTAPVGATPRTLELANVRIDEYNRVGLLLDGGVDDGSPVTASGLDLRGTVSTSQIVGRTLCWDAHVHGDCGGPQPPGNPDPQPLDEGPRFGQDGIRIAAGARGAISGSLITQNLVQGEDAPVRNSATNNQYLREAAGIRLVGADAANSSVTRSNIVDNAYGILNVAADGTADAAAPMSALNNWWGLWSPVGSNPPQPTPPNDGPEVSPVTNPPYPENPVNGAPAADGSSTVAFTPFRGGPQGDPNTGQFPVVPAPIPVADTAPELTVSPERAKYERGETVKLIADPKDDFGIRQVTFFDGATDVGSDRSPAYTAAFTLPDDAPCGARQVAATAEDSLGQTATATGALEVVCDSGPTLEPPTIQLPQNLTTIRRSGATVTLSPVAKQGVAKVEVFLGTRLVCRDTEAPYTCVIKPRSDEIGSQTLRALVTDLVGLTGQDSRQVDVPRFAPRSFKLDVDRKRLKGNRVRRTVTAIVVPPGGVKRATACANGRVAAVVKRGGSTLLDREVKLNRRCRARVMRLTTRRSSSRKLRFKASARFGGTTVLAPARTTRRFR